MAKQVQPLEIILGIKGAEKLAALKSSFRDLTKTVKQSDADIESARKSINDYVKSANNSEAVIRGQIKAFEGLREQAAMGGKVYRELSDDITELRAQLTGSTSAIDAQRKSILELASGAEVTAKQVQKTIDKLSALRSETRLDSGAFNAFGKDIDSLTGKLDELAAKSEAAAKKSRLLSGPVRSTPGQIKAQLQVNKEEAAAIQSQIDAIDELDSRQRKLKETVEKRAALEEKLANRLKIASQTGFLASVSAGRKAVISAANAFNDVDAAIGSFSTRLRLLDQDFGKIPNTVAGSNQKLRELQEQFANTARSADNYVAVALEVARVQREASAATQGLGAALVNDLASGVAVRNQKNLREVIGQLQAEMSELNTETAEGSAKYAENARQVNRLQKELDGIANSYRTVADVARQAGMAMGGSLNPFTVAGGRRRATPDFAAYEQPIGPEISPAAKQAAEDRKQEIRDRIANLKRINAENDALREQNAIRRSIAKNREKVAARAGIDRPMREISDLYKGIADIGMSKIAADIDRMGNSYYQVANDIKNATKASNGSINSLQAQRNAWASLRAGLDPTSKAYQDVGREIEKVDRRLEKLNRSRRRMSSMQMTQAAGAAISGGIFGGLEGFLGGVGGALVGGVGGAFAGAAFGAQVGGFRRTLGEFADYAAGIQKLQIALREAAGDQDQYNKAVAAAQSVTKDLNVPQEIAIQNMTKLTAAVKGAGGQVSDAALVFRNVTSAIIGTGGSAEDVNGAITAMVQVFSKGKVSAEELTGQLGERLAGAVTRFAEANEMSLTGLQDGLKKGEIGLNELMNFIVQLGVDFNEVAEEIAASSQSAGARLQIAFNQMKIDVGAALQPIGAELQDAFTKFIKETTPALTDSAKAIALLLKSIMDSKDVILPVISLTAKIVALKLAFTGLTALKAATVGFFAASAGGAKITGDAMVGLTAKMNGLKAAVKSLAIAFAALQTFEYLFKAFARGQELEVLTQRAESGAAATELQGKSREEIIEAQNQAQEKFIELLKEEERLKAKLGKANVFSVMFGTLGRTASDLQKVRLEMEGLYDVFGVKIPGADKPTNWKSPEELAAEEKQRATSLLNAIEQRENAIAQARIQLEEQAANIRKQAIEQAKQLEESIAKQRLDKERQIEDLRRQLAYIEEDIALGAEEARFVAGGGDPEVFRVRREIIEFARQQKEEEISLDRQLLDEQTETQKAIEEFKSNNAKAIMEANTAHAKQIGRIQQEYARSVAKIVEEGTGRAGKRLEVAGTIVAQEIKKAEAQATALTLGFSFTREGKVSGPLEALPRDSVEYSQLEAAYEAFTDAQKAIDKANESLSGIPTATAIAAPAIDSISMSFDDLNFKLAASASGLEAVRSQIKGISSDISVAEFSDKLSKAFMQVGAGTYTAQRTMQSEAKRSKNVLRLREEGYSQRVAERLAEQEARAVSEISLYDAIRDQALKELEKNKKSAKEEFSRKLELTEDAQELANLRIAYEETLGVIQEKQDAVKQNFADFSELIRGSHDAVRDLTIALDNIPTEIKLRTAVVDLKQQLKDLVDPSNQIKGAAIAIGDAFAQSFVDAISGAKTAKEALADFFQSVGSYFLDMAKQIIAKMIQIAILNSVAKLLPGLGSSGSTGFNLNGMGQAFAPGGSMPFPMLANGGPVTGGSPYIVGERGPELFVPQQSGAVVNNDQLSAAMGRYRRSGTTATNESAAAIQGGEGGTAVMDKPIDVRYTVDRINNVDYVTAEQFQQGMRQAAQQGAQRGEQQTIKRLQMSSSTRKRLGL